MDRRFEADEGSEFDSSGVGSTANPLYSVSTTKRDLEDEGIEWKGRES